MIQASWSQASWSICRVWEDQTKTTDRRWVLLSSNFHVIQWNGVNTFSPSERSQIMWSLQLKNPRGIGADWYCKIRILITLPYCANYLLLRQELSEILLRLIWSLILGGQHLWPSWWNRPGLRVNISSHKVKTHLKIECLYPRKRLKEIYSELRIFRRCWKRDLCSFSWREIMLITLKREQQIPASLVERYTVDHHLTLP